MLLRHLVIVCLLAPLFVTPASSTAARAQRSASPAPRSPEARLDEIVREGGTLESFRSVQSELLRAGGFTALGVADDGTLYNPSIRPLPAGDLDGDGREDLFTTSYEDDAWMLRARRGIDGSVLWSSPIHVEEYYRGYAFIGRIDVAGSGVPEVVVFSVEVDETTPSSDPLVTAAVLDQRVRTLDPGSGKPLWERRFDGVFAAAGKIGYIAGAQGIVFDVDVSPDASGDGRDDVLVEVGDWGALFPAASGVHVTGIVIDGFTGADAARLDLVEPNGTPALLPTQDLSGDGLADVITVRGRRIIAYDMGTKLPLWVTFADVWAQRPWVRVLPLRDDGTSDLLVLGWNGDWVGRVWDVVAISGIDGRELWRRDKVHAYAALEPTGDLDGDGGVDLLGVGVADSRSSWDQHGVTLRALSGETGEEIWGPVRHHIEVESGQTAFYYCYPCLADLTGDGVLDAYASFVHADPSKDENPEWVQAFDGETGSTLWKRDGRSFIRSAEADVDADGGTELWVTSREEDGWSLHVIDGGTADLLWSTPTSVNGEFPESTFGADVDGEPGDELVLWLDRCDSELNNCTHAVEVHGPSGMLWRLDG